ncbi:MAG: ExeA family protein [Gammaproteobacteria bacterium]
MYMDYFKLKKYPFGLTPNTEFFCDLEDYHSALSVLLLSLENNEGFIKIIGEVGSGKTLLCRLLLNRLDNDRFETAYIPNPDLDASELRKALAQELNIPFDSATEISTLNSRINQALLEISKRGKQLVFIVDEAQCMPDDTLEALRLLTNLETESEKLLQIVLFGQPELDEKLNTHRFRHLKQRIVFSYQLRPLTLKETHAYVFHRLAIAGQTTGNLYSDEAIDYLHRCSGGIPRLINILCHKALLSAYSQGKICADKQDMQAAVEDTPAAEQFSDVPAKSYSLVFGVVVAAVAVGLIVDYFLGLIHL